MRGLSAALLFVAACSSAATQDPTTPVLASATADAGPEADAASGTDAAVGDAYQSFPDAGADAAEDSASTTPDASTCSCDYGSCAGPDGKTCTCERSASVDSFCAGHPPHFVSCQSASSPGVSGCLQLSTGSYCCP